MSFLKKLAKGAGKVLSKVGGTSSKILGTVGKITGGIDRAFGGQLSSALMANPLTAKAMAGYQLAKAGTRAVSGVGKALEGGNIVKGIKEVQKVAPSLQNQARSFSQMQSNPNLDIGAGGIGG